MSSLTPEHFAVLPPRIVRPDEFPFTVVETESTGKGLFANKDLSTGEIVMYLEGPCLPKNQLTKEDFVHVLQVDDDLFQVSAIPGRPDDNFNHSCDPNCLMIVRKKEGGNFYIWVQALRPIKKDEQLSFFYPSTEKNQGKDGQDSGFHCECGSESCIHNVEGLENMTVRDFLKYSHILLISSDYIGRIVENLLQYHVSEMIDAPLDEPQIYS